jgi:hypothetical protein
MTKAPPLLMASVLALAGCGATTGIVPVAPSTYAVSEMRAPALGGGAEARRVALAEADGFCRQQGRAFSPLSLRPDGDPFTPYYPTAFDVTFRCLRTDSPVDTGQPVP